MTQSSSPKNVKYINGPTSYNIRCEDDVLQVDTSGGAVSLYLPNIKNAGMDLYPKVFYINDTGGVAATNNITIYSLPGNTVNGGASVAMRTNSETAECIVNGLTQWQATTSGGGGGGGGSVTTTDNIVAAVSGLQVDATACPSDFNSVTVAAVDGASVKTIDATVDSTQVIQNNSSTNGINVYPQLGQQFRGLANNAPIYVSPGNQIKVVCYQNGVWTQG